MNKAMMSKGAIRFALIFALLIGIILSIYIIPSAKSGPEQETPTPSNCTVGKNVAFSFSTNLTAGILFGTVQESTNNNNATGNYNYTNNNGSTQYWITIDQTTNTYANLCIRDDQALTSGSYNIPNSNYMYSYNKTYNNWTIPVYPGSIAISTTYAYLNELNGSLAGNRSYYRFTLSIPSGQQTGDYSNTMYFKITENATTC